jgi:hypothetical protein
MLLFWYFTFWSWIVNKYGYSDDNGRGKQQNDQFFKFKQVHTYPSSNSTDDYIVSDEIVQKNCTD